ncbi:dihydrofolate reductase family protein [Agromyces sp. NPDC060279]|uniref:dihydrofolate reductase family protein n=1 Tax=Agromyces sp. NPDC060279 TaxID=3347092 RepID=UPI0036693A73
MGRLTLEQIVSADGYAADEHGGLDFVEAVPAFDVTDDDQLAYLEDVDAILLGANSYRMFAEYWPVADPATQPVAEPIARLPKLVVSNTLERAPWGDGEATLLRGEPAESVAALKAEREHVIVWGSLQLAGALRLRVVPVLLGAGRSFTPDAPALQRLELDHVVSFPTGHLGLTYRLAR